ncbi:hypothetical protein GN157_11095 [Flavobacterium rakeshii]|uniref:Lipoprotein n=1 Tax=Flavobacterium rakeshii TaxID=1038845 RepID=A0A6N8HED4_9FLAO|nr:hypothetical protein [Flavobacterium rakeshii]MUV04256.1 hypothetical protein [Flavobacterium rakeshii]
MYFRFLFFSVSIFILISCSGNHFKESSLPDFEDKTGCFTKEEIFLILKRQVNTKVGASILDRDDNLTKSCNGVFFLMINDWEKANTRRRYVYVPILKIGERVMINTTLDEKTSVKDSIRVKNEIDFFRKNAVNIFNEYELDQIEELYSHGVGFYPKGRL